MSKHWMAGWVFAVVGIGLSLAQDPPKPPSDTPQPPPPVATPAQPQTATAPAAPQPAVQGAPKIKLSENAWDFGEIVYGDMATHTFKITNEGAAALELGKLKGSCACTVPDKPVKKHLEPGESTDVKVNFNSKKKQGKIMTVVYVDSNDPVSPRVEFRITGHVKTLIDVEPISGIMIRTLDPNKPASGTARIFNRTDKPIKPVIKMVNGSAVDLALKEIEAGKVYELIATTKPPLKFGRTSMTAEIATEMEKMPTLAVTIVADMQESVEVRPAVILKKKESKDATTHTISLRYFGADPEFKVTEIVSDNPAVKVEQQPAVRKPPAPVQKDGTPPAIAKMTMEVPLIVSIGSGSDIPDAGTKIVIRTTDPNYKELQLLITGDKTVFQQKMAERTGVPTELAGIGGGGKKGGGTEEGKQAAIDRLNELAKEMNAKKAERKKARAAQKQATSAPAPVQEEIESHGEDESQEGHEHEEPESHP